MKLEYICPCCNKKIKVIISDNNLSISENDDDNKNNQKDLESELFDKHKILLG